MCFKVKVFCEIDSSNSENNYNLKCVKFHIVIQNYYAFILIGKFIFIHYSYFRVLVHGSCLLVHGSYLPFLAPMA